MVIFLEGLASAQFLRQGPATEMEMFGFALWFYFPIITSAAPIRSVLENMAEDPYFYTFNILLVLILLSLGGIFAGKTKPNNAYIRRIIAVLNS